MHTPLDERARRWIEQADGDLAAAELLRERQPHLACFHAQQAAEKATKAVLTRLSGDSIPTHEIARLMEACETLGASASEDVRTSGRSLDKYYVPTRYPDALGFADAALTYGAEDVAAATKASRIVRRWADEAIAAARKADPDPP